MIPINESLARDSTRDRDENDDRTSKRKREDADEINQRKMRTDTLNRDIALPLLTGGTERYFHRILSLSLLSTHSNFIYFFFSLHILL